MADTTKYWTLHVLVEGRVQGVFFRESTRREASALGLSGWVRNLADGRVEARFTGPRAACEKALAFVHRGPPSASVTNVRAGWEESNETPSGEFEVR
jgi:acylphosphatase